MRKRGGKRGGGKRGGGRRESVTVQKKLPHSKPKNPNRRTIKVRFA
ncbi:hypothetical protein L195_g054796 [Trifolium pratense]|uniref:Uncharacterized protein n=1 Tax=Trifolium pratense TaxID=57577 RepID=A0A2K3KI28_TRIPR|nr:hypothetical protein L195_g054796 [Trifolium pratense]